MSLNIKNPQTHDLAAELARRLDTSLTEAVTIALRDKLAATEAEAVIEARLARILRAAGAVSERITAEQKAMDIDSELYDEAGLPR